MEVIKLNFINRSNDTNKSSVVIFQKNIAGDSSETAIAWKVIRNCGRLNNHPFKYPLNFHVCTSDSYGNYTPSLVAEGGQAFEGTDSVSGSIFQLAVTPAGKTTEVEVRNNMPIGAINANCFRDGRLLATMGGVAPGQKAVFEFHPVIYIGTVSSVDEGDVLDATVISQINTEINLFGIKSADIVMSGGGPGPSSTPFRFTLENINT